MSLYLNQKELSESTGIIMHNGTTEIPEVNYNNITIWKKQKGGTPYTLTFTSTAGWTKIVKQHYFADNGPGISFYSTIDKSIHVGGTGGGGYAYAIGGYYKDINTNGCLYVDVYPSGANSSMNLGRNIANIQLDNVIIAPISATAASSARLNVPIDPNKEIQRLYLEISSGGDNYNAHGVGLVKLVFHN